MSMTSKERVLCAFDHDEPDRVPLWFGMSPEFSARAMAELGADEEGVRRRLGDDFRRISAPFRMPGGALPEGVTCRTVFGVDRHGLGYGQPLSHALAGASLADVAAYEWPDASCVDVSTLRAQSEPWADGYAILGGDWSPFWHDLIDLMGMEDLYFAMHDTPEVVDAVLGHLVDFYAESSRRIFDEAGDLIDIFFIGNDLGSQTGPLLGPEHFARFILAHLKRLIDLGHEYGLQVQLHCCGGFRPLLPLLIDAGLDAVHAIQPCCHGMDLAELKRDFGERIVFNGAIDSQHVLIEGNPASVRRATGAVLDIMAPGGGYIAGASHDWILEETPVANVVAMADAVMAYGPPLHRS